jgi:hypothetical protein
VCPFNLKFSEPAAEPGYAARGPGERPVGVEAEPNSPESRGKSVHPGTDAPALIELLSMALSEESWESFSRGSAVRRAGRAGFTRNVCVALGNWLAGEEEPPPEGVRLLVEALSDPEPLVRGHAAWALGRISSAAARSALERRASVEKDPWVGAELIAPREGSRPTRM